MRNQRSPGTLRSEAELESGFELVQAVLATSAVKAVWPSSSGYPGMPSEETDFGSDAKAHDLPPSIRAKMCSCSCTGMATPEVVTDQSVVRQPALFSVDDTVEVAAITLCVAYRSTLPLS